MDFIYGTKGEKSLFELVQIALGHRKQLSASLSRDEWAELYAMAEKQSLIGVCFSGIEKLQLYGQCPPTDILLEWYAKKEMVRRMNDLQVEEINEVCRILGADGLKPCIVKGQSLTTYYPAQLKGLRQCGDIDVLVTDSDVNVLRYALAHEGETMEWGYKHVHMNIVNNSCVDLHYRLAMSRNLWRNRKIQKWNRNLKHRGCGNMKGGSCPTLELDDNVVFLLLHASWHFLFEGVGLRHLMDIYFVIQSAKDIEIKEKIRDFGLEKFAGACSWVMWHVFEGCDPKSALLSDGTVLPPPNEKNGLFLLKEILETGNFGKFDKRKTVKKEDGVLVTIIKKWIHYTRLAKNYPVEFLWLPIGSLYVRLWKWKMGNKVYG